MSKESLDSERVNYMIWRYLNDSGYRETAVRLQQEWNTPDPQQLSCATHVPNHALVVLLNRGLVYSVLDREDAQMSQAGDGAAVTGFFGPLTPTSTTSAAADEEDFENARKRQMDNEQPQNGNGPPAKRARLSNGYENGASNANGNGNALEHTPMDLDEEPNPTPNPNPNPNANADENAYPSPEQLPSPVVATVGPEQGTQVDKVSELSTETVFLELSDDQASRNSVLLQCEWNPRDPDILAAAGTDALARLWTLSRTVADSGPEAQRKPLPIPHRNLLSESASQTTTVTGLAWSSDGGCVAVASEPLEDGSAKVDFWAKDLRHMSSFNTFESPIILLRWNPASKLCLSLSPDNGGRATVITVMHPADDKKASYTIPDHSLHDQSLDATWTSDADFVIGGGDLLQALHYNEHDGVFSMTRKYETRDSHALSILTFDARSNLLATASETGTIDIWDQSGQGRSFNAHQGVITSLDWQPLQDGTPLGDDAVRLLASAGEDGAISLWDARSSESKSKSSMTMGSSVVSIAFTPDGVFIAGATTDRIFIWKVEDPILPRASWLRSDQSGWRTPMSQDSTSDENQYSLSWNAAGHKLAYGVGTSLALINFGR